MGKKRKLRNNNKHFVDDLICSKRRFHKSLNFNINDLFLNMRPQKYWT
jgi:hypothetical protein